MSESGIMSFVKRQRHVYALALAAAFAGAAGAQVKVDAPNAASAHLVVNSPFYLQAEASTCQSHPVTKMAYSVDDNQDAGTFQAQSIQTMVTGVANGAHTIHVKAWNGVGDEVCTQDVTLTVGGGLTVSAPAQEGIKLPAPWDNLPPQWATVKSPFVLAEHAISCGGEPTHAMTYSLDNGQDITTDGTSLNTTVEASIGPHILRGKTWGSSGVLCETDIRFNVASSSGLVPASGALSRANFEQTDDEYKGRYGTGCPDNGALDPHLEVWQTQPDCKTPGNKSNYSTDTVATPIYDDQPVDGKPPESRTFTMTYDTQYGGVRWFDQAIPYKDENGTVIFPQEPSATHFQYDAYVYLVDNSKVSNIEMDINHSINGTGQLYILAAQCNLHRHVWQVTAAGGWVDTDIPCTTAQVTSSVWHHFQIQTHHDASGQGISYDAVAIDGIVHNIGTCYHPKGSTYDSSEATSGNETSCQNASSNHNWSDFIGPNFQLDGEGSNGTATAYVDDFTVYYWHQ